MPDQFLLLPLELSTNKKIYFYFTGSIVGGVLRDKIFIRKKKKKNVVESFNNPLIEIYVRKFHLKLLLKITRLYTVDKTNCNIVKYK